jgi:Putative lumazine-binding
MAARTDDYDAIVHVMQLYLDAFNDNDVRKFREAFDEDAWIYSIDADGSLHKHPISEDFERWATPPSWNVVGRFVSLTHLGDAAAVQLSFDSEKSGGGWMDFHHLIKVNGAWKITNKTATHISRCRPPGY